MGLNFNPQQVADLAKALIPAVVAAVQPAVTDAARDAVKADAAKAMDAAKGNRSETPGANADKPAGGSEPSTPGALGEALTESRKAYQAGGSGQLEATFKSYKMGRPVIEGTGIMLARGIKAMYVAKTTGRTPADVARGWGYTDLAKALQQNLFTAGGSLVHEAYAAELVPLLRNEAVVRRAGARVIPMGATLRWDRQTGSATAGYGSENSAITVSEPATDQFELSEKKETALVPFSNDIMRNASISTEEFVRNDLVRVMALAEDSAFLRGDGTQGSPRGIRFRLASAHVYTETITTEGTPTLAEAKKELAKAKKKIRVAKIPMTRMVWIASPNLEYSLNSITGPGGEGVNELERELNERGTLRGYPVFISNQVPVNVIDTGTGATGSAAGNDRSELYLIDMDQVIIGESMGLEVEVFPNGTFSNSGTVVSGISNDLTVVRAIAKHDINLRYTTCGVCVSNSSWGQG